MTRTPAPAVDGDFALAATAVGTAEVVESATQGLGRGAIVGRYVVLSKIGAGGMGEVFMALDPELDRRVALKILRAGGTELIPEAQARLLREAQALARLNHPHVVAIHDVGEHQGAVWLAMEYVQGITLAKWESERRRSWGDVLDVLTPVAQGLAAAHEAGLVHRDTKPENIMIGTDGRVRVMDLGLARVVGPQEGLSESVTPAAATLAAETPVQVTRAGAIVGTPAYMSPEQFMGQSVDERTDVFSFSVTLWEALMGERPFSGETGEQLMMAVLRGKLMPVPRDSVSLRVPMWLIRVCERGLAVDPSLRFQNMRDLLGAIESQRARGRMHRWLMGAVAVGMLGVGGASIELYEHAAREVECEKDGLQIYQGWTDDVQRKVRDAVLATGVSYAPETADNVIPLLDRYAESWRKTRAEVCLGEVNGSAAAGLVGRSIWCLDERQMGFEALVGELLRGGDPAVQMAVVAAAELPNVSVCVDERAMHTLPSPPPLSMQAGWNLARRLVAKSQALLASGDYQHGLDVARAASMWGDSLDASVVAASARLVEGRMLQKMGLYAESEAVTIGAYVQAAKAHAWDVAANAANDLIFTVGFWQVRHGEGLVWADHAQVASYLAGDEAGLLAAERMNSLANLRYSMGGYADARSLHERSLAIREAALGGGHPTVAVSLGNLAEAFRMLGLYDDARKLQARALWIREVSLGTNHPDVANSLSNLAAVYYDDGDFERARELLERALAIWRDALGSSSLVVARCMGNIGNVALRQGRVQDALDFLEASVSIYETHDGYPDGASSTRFDLARTLVDSGKDRARGLAVARRAADGFRAAGESRARDLVEVQRFINDLETAPH